MLQERLEELGINVEEVLEDYFGDDFEIYEETLIAFAKDKKTDELRQALDKGDTSAAFEAAHCLKASVGMTGYDELFKKLVVLVEKLRNGEMPQKEEIDAYFNGYDRLMETVEG